MVSNVHKNTGAAIGLNGLQALVKDSHLKNKGREISGRSSNMQMKTFLNFLKHNDNFKLILFVNINQVIHPK